MRGPRLLVLAGFAGTAAAVVVALVTGSPDPAATPPISVAVTRAALSAGTAVGPAQVEMVALGKGGSPPSGAITQLSAIDNRIARRDIAAGTVLLASDLWQGNAEGSLMPAPGHLAFSTRTADIGQVIGFEGPGSKVDVLLSATRNVPQPFSRVVLRGVRVLAIAPEPPAEKPGNESTRTTRVTLELSPAEAERLDLARHVGDLTLVVRSADSPAGDGGESRGARIADLLGNGARDLLPGAAAEAAPRPAAATLTPAKSNQKPGRETAPRPLVTVEEIRGGKVTQRQGPPESEDNGS